MPRAILATSCTTTIAVAASTALAQPAITIDIDNPVLLPGESTVVTLWAGFDADDYAMAGLETSLVTSVGSEGWSDLRLVEPMDGPGTSSGGAVASGIEAIIAGQLHIPWHGFDADASNPIAFWEATYTASRDVEKPIDIDLLTTTSRYDVYVLRDTARAEPRLTDLVEGAATIRVIPATPTASALLLALGAVAARRRR
jgi:hypothetical protein